MNGRGQPLSGGEQPFRHFMSRPIVAEGHDYGVVLDVGERRKRTENLEAEDDGACEAGRIVNQADGLGIEARLVRALQNVGDDGPLTSGADDDDSL